MMLVLDFSPNWYILTIIGMVFFALFYFLRKDREKKNLRFNAVMGFMGLSFSLLIEVISVYMGLWNYTGGNWPAILWVDYFIFSMGGYQMFKFAEERLLGKKP